MARAFAGCCLQRRHRLGGAERLFCHSAGTCVLAGNCVCSVGVCQPSGSCVLVESCCLCPSWHASTLSACCTLQQACKQGDFEYMWSAAACDAGLEEEMQLAGHGLATEAVRVLVTAQTLTCTMQCKSGQSCEGMAADSLIGPRSDSSLSLVASVRCGGPGSVEGIPQWHSAGDWEREGRWWCFNGMPVEAHMSGESK